MEIESYILDIIKEPEKYQFYIYTDNKVSIENVKNRRIKKLNENQQLKICTFIHDHKQVILDALKKSYFNLVNCEPFQDYISYLFKEPRNLTDQCPNFFKLLLSNWQNSLSHEFLNIPLKHILVPGTHNSCAFDIIWDKRPTCMNSYIFGCARSNFIKPKCEGLVKTQNLNLIEQFESGIRLFDFRLSKDDENNFYISRTFYVRNLENCLSDLEYILSTYKHEFLIITIKIDYEHRSCINTEDINVAFNMIVNKLDGYMVPKDEDLGRLNLNRIKESGKNLIVFSLLRPECIDRLDSQIKNQIRFHESKEIWPNEDNFNSLWKKCCEIGDSLNDTNKYLHFSYIITPRKLTSVRALSKSNSIKELSQNKELEDKLGTFLSSLNEIHTRSSGRLSGITLDYPSQRSIQKIISFNSIFENRT
jgi:hypothetical protein